MNNVPYIDLWNLSEEKATKKVVKNKVDGEDNNYTPYALKSGWKRTDGSTHNLGSSYLKKVPKAINLE